MDNTDFTSNKAVSIGIDSAERIASNLRAAIDDRLSRVGDEKEFQPQSLSIGGYPVKRNHYFLILSTVLEVMEKGTPVRTAVRVGKESLAKYGYKKPTGSYFFVPDVRYDKETYFNTLLCFAPPKYIPLLKEEGADINQLHVHPVYNCSSFKIKYPALVFAAYNADAPRVQALFEAGADEMYGFTAAEQCLKAEHTAENQKIACLQALKMAGVDLFNDYNYSKLTGLIEDGVLKDWLEEGKIGYDARKKVAHHNNKYVQNLSMQNQKN